MLSVLKPDKKWGPNDAELFIEYKNFQNKLEYRQIFKNHKFLNQIFQNIFG